MMWPNSAFGFPILHNLLEFLGFLEILGVLVRQVSLYRWSPGNSKIPGLPVETSSLYKRPAEYPFVILEKALILRQLSLSTQTVELSTRSLLVWHSLWVQHKWTRQRMMSVLPNQCLSWVFSTLGQCYVSSQPVLYFPHTQTRIALFACLTNKHSLLETFSQPCCNWLFSNCLSHNSPAKGWPYRFRTRGTTGSSTLDHDFGHLCRGRRIQICSIWIFWTMVVHLPFWLVCKQILRQVLVLHIQEIFIYTTYFTFADVICVVLASAITSSCVHQLRNKSILHYALEFLLVKINEVNTTQTSGIVELWFFDRPLLILFAFLCIRHLFPHLWP